MNEVSSRISRKHVLSLSALFYKSSRKVYFASLHEFHMLSKIKHFKLSVEKDFKRNIKRSKYFFLIIKSIANFKESITSYEKELSVF